jgi:hypothetical protein
MAKEIEFKTTFIRDPLKQKSDNWQETAHKWLVTINGQDFDFYTGLGHRTACRMGRIGTGFTYDQLKNKNLTESGLKTLLKISKPTPPKLDDVLFSLVNDASANSMSFAEWCSNYGYEVDSRKAFSLYEQCQNNADKLRKAGIDIEKERERLEDY